MDDEALFSPAAETAAAELSSLALSLAIGDPAAFGGVVIRGRWGELQRQFLQALDHQRIPPSVDESRLSGGLDLAATLSAGRAVWSQGLLTAAKTPLVLTSAERADTAVVAALSEFLDNAGTGAVHARAILALDETDGDDPPLDRRLEDRLAFIVRADALLPTLRPLPVDWRNVAIGDQDVATLATTALVLGVDTLRASIAAVAAAQAIAALRGAGRVGERDMEAAAALVLAPRATQIPAPPAEDDVAPPPPPSPPPPSHEPVETPEDDAAPPSEGAAEKLVDAVAAQLPPGLLAGDTFALTRGKMGRAGATVAATRGRPAGVRAGRPDRGVRLALSETLTAAAPWRHVRGGEPGRVPVRAEDLRIRRIKGKAGTLTIFCVDASGSQAYARMAEAKGAVERVLADAYARRDQVALVAFRGEDAEVLLPPTPSLTRAKRALAALPGGGGTPLAAGLSAALRLAIPAVRDGTTVTLLVLTDARANVSLDGQGGRERAFEEATAVANRLAVLPLRTVVVDTGRRPGAQAKSLAEAMLARYVPLPAATADTLTAIARPPSSR